MTTREGNELVVQKENCVLEEIKEVELRSRRGKFIYNLQFHWFKSGQSITFSARQITIKSRL